MSVGKYLLGYPPELLTKASELLAQGRLGRWWAGIRGR